MRHLVREHAAHLLAGKMAKQALRDGDDRLLGASPRGKGVRLVGRDQIDARHRDSRPAGDLLDVAEELRLLALLGGDGLAGLQREPVREPEHDEVEDDRDAREEDDSAPAADEPTEPDEERGKASEDDPRPGLGGELCAPDRHWGFVFLSG